MPATEVKRESPLFRLAQKKGLSQLEADVYLTVVRPGASGMLYKQIVKALEYPERAVRKALEALVDDHKLLREKGNERYSFADLNAYAEYKLAAFLQSQGVPVVAGRAKKSEVMRVLSDTSTLASVSAEDLMTFVGKYQELGDFVGSKIRDLLNGKQIDETSAQKIQLMLGGMNDELDQAIDGALSGKVAANYNKTQNRIITNYFNELKEAIKKKEKDFHVDDGGIWWFPIGNGEEVMATPHYDGDDGIQVDVLDEEDGDIYMEYDKHWSLSGDLEKDVKTYIETVKALADKAKEQIFRSE